MPLSLYKLAFNLENSLHVKLSRILTGTNRFDRLIFAIIWSTFIFFSGNTLLSDTSAAFIFEVSSKITDA